MLHRTCIALLLLLSACATTEPILGELETPNPRIANLQRAAQYPWTDDGHCVVREASNEWPVLAERCYHALDYDRVKFRDVTGKCAVASAGAAAVGVGLCVFVAPEVIVGAVIIAGVVVVAVAIKEELDAYERSASHERGRPKTRTRPTNEQEPVANRKLKPEGSPLGRDWLPPISSDPTEHPECKPIPGPPRGGNDPHNECANKIPGNDFPGLNVFVNGKHFDALVLAARTLWEVKTDNFDIHSPRSQAFFAKVKLPEIRREARLAKECGYNFVVGVKSAAHKAALEKLDESLVIIVMDWC
jgi:Family of unknown function (DUF6310)